MSIWLIFSFFFLFFSFIFLFLNINLLLVIKIFKNFLFFLLFDSISILFLFYLYLIVSCVFLFSKIYVSRYYKNSQFFWILFSFILRMKFLILFPDFFFLLLGWDGLGISRVLLIFFYNRKSSFFRAIKTFRIKRLGDGFLIIFLFFLLQKKRFLVIFKKIRFLTTTFFLLLISGLKTKRAQFPFRSWLPAAMAAPTPVSALVHSSTLVTAGLFLIIRNFRCINYNFSFFLVILGVWTLIYSRISCLFEKDFKKAIALSTLSQLGLIFTILGFNFLKFGFFHLLSHAGFKALLFIIRGYFIFKFYHHQDLRFLSNSKKKIFLNIILFSTICSLRGLLFSSGFFSKDCFLEGLKLNNSFFLKLFFFFIIILTLVYSFRLYFSISKNSKNFYSNQDFYFKFIGIIILWIPSIFFGFCFKKIFFKTLTLKNFKKKLILLLLILYFFFSTLNFSRKNFYFSYFFLFFFKSSFFNSIFLKKVNFFLKKIDTNWSLNFFYRVKELINFHLRNFFFYFLNLNFSKLWFFFLFLTFLRIILLIF